MWPWLLVLGSGDTNEEEVLNAQAILIVMKNRYQFKRLLLKVTTCQYAMLVLYFSSVWELNTYYLII